MPTKSRPPASPELRAKRSANQLAYWKRQREWEAKPELPKLKKHEVTVGEDGLLYRRGRVIKCRRNVEIQNMRAEGKDEVEIRAFIEYFTIKGLE